MIPWTSKLTQLERLLVHHEGMRLKPYTDTVGVLTIGIGRNLSQVGISEDEALFLMRNDLTKLEDLLEGHFKFFNLLNAVRKMALVSMGFNLGFKGLLSFKKFLHALAEQDFENAAREMLESKWARQVGQRAIDLSEMIHTGEMPEDLEAVLKKAIPELP